MLPAPPFQLLERYDVVEEIGRGGHAIVFRAHDTLLGRDVAIKVLRDDVGSPDIVRRFQQEIQLLAKLEHAHILHVHDSGTVDGRPFVIMELAPMATLGRRLQREPQLPVADAVQIAREVGSALAHAHARGILHRDVKPDNILLSTGGAVLADFGIARITGEHDISRITSTGEAVGTLAYMSPEQLCAEPIDARSDQYALGCVLYEMLAGVRPHAAATLEGLRALRLTGQQPPVTVHRPAVSPALEDILARMIAVAPADRFRSLDEVVMALDLLRTTDIPVGGMQTPTGGRTPPSGARRVTSPGGTDAIAPPAEEGALPVLTGGRGRVLAVAAATVLVAGVSVANWLRGGSDDAPAVPGALTIALRPAGDTLAGAVRMRLRDEMSAWRGVAVQDGSTRGGVLVSTAVTRLGDSVQLRLDVRDSAAASVRQVWRLLPARVVDSSASPTMAAAVASLAREVLAGRGLESLRGVETIPSRSLPALRAFVRGFDHLYAGQLDSATAAFRAARDAAPGFAAAHLWAAQSAAWAQPRQPVQWLADADGAARIGGLDSGLTFLTRALGHMARRAYPEACAVYRQAERLDAVRFEALVGLGDCQRLDDVVVRTPQGLRFRSSHWGAMQAYLRAVDEAPTSELLGALMPRMRRMTYAEGAQVRRGFTARDTLVALSSLTADTIWHLPLSPAQSRSGVPATWFAATRRGLVMAVELTRRWTRRFPGSAAAWLAHSASLEQAGMISVGDSTHAPSALDRAIALGLPASTRGEVAIALVRFAIRRGALDSAAAAARRALQDTLVTRASSPELLASLATLVGDASALAYWHRADSTMRAAVPSNVLDSLVAFERLALLSRCDELKARRAGLDSVFRGSVPDAAIEAQRSRWLPDLLRLAAPCLGPRAMVGYPAVAPADEVLLLLAKGDTTGARIRLSTLRSERRGAAVSSVTWDYRSLESWAVAMTGDTLTAIRQLVDALDGLPSTSSSTILRPEQMMGLRRSVLLLRDLTSGANSKRTIDPALAARVGRWRGHAEALGPP